VLPHATAPAAAPPWVQGSAAYRSELARNLRMAGGAMVAASYAVPLGPHVGTLCPLRRLTGVPCPFCGLTTGVVDATHGHLAGSALANPVAPLLVAATVVGWVVWALSRAGWLTLRWAPPARLGTWARWAVAPALLAVWLFELGRFGWL
jgi:hypothetical protein